MCSTSCLAGRGSRQLRYVLQGQGQFPLRGQLRGQIGPRSVSLHSLRCFSTLNQRENKSRISLLNVACPFVSGQNGKRSNAPFSPPKNWLSTSEIHRYPPHPCRNSPNHFTKFPSDLRSNNESSNFPENREIPEHFSNSENSRESSKSWRSRISLILGSAALTLATTLLAKKAKDETDLSASFKVKAAQRIDEGQFRGQDGKKGQQRSRRNSYNFIADVVDEVKDSLVYIEIKDLGSRDFYTGVPMTQSNGSGFVVASDGLILTNAHVVINKPRSSVQVKLPDGRVFTGSVEDVDVKSDLATVRIPAKGLQVMPLGQSSTVRPGEFVIAMGCPLSLSNTITTGVVSASRARAELGLRDKDVPDYIQTDAAITFGNSGGPLVNLDGEAIGINSMKVTPGISFAIPIDHAKEFLRKSQQNKANLAKTQQSIADRRYIGLTMLTISPQIIDELRQRLEIHPKVSHGIVVFRIVRGSPAENAGLMPGDVITHINGKAIRATKDVYSLLENHEIHTLTMTVVRKSKAFKIIVQPELGD